MFATKKWASLFALVIIASMVLSACATPTPQIIRETVKETVIIAGTPQVVEKVVEKVVTATPKPKAEEPVRLFFIYLAKLMHVIAVFAARDTKHSRLVRLTSPAWVVPFLIFT